MRKKNLIMSLAVLAVLLSLPVSWNVSAQKHKPDLITSVGSELTFQLSGGRGVFFANKPCSYSVENSYEIVLQFSASELVYLGSPWTKQAKLDNVLYWLDNNPHLSFKPGQVLRLSKKPGLHHFSIHGKVTVNAVEDQPAGDYQGTICITVSAAK